jgi:hypothetical protein
MKLSIFEVRDDQPRITAEGLFIPEFLAVWNSDKSKDKTTAQLKLAYVFHMSSYTSAYANLGPQRYEEVYKDYLAKKKIKVDAKMEAAIEKYKKLQETAEVRALDAALVLCDKLSAHFKSIDLSQTDKSGKLIHDSRKLMMNLEKVGKVVESLTKMRKDVARGMAEMQSNKGAGGNMVDELLG